MSDFSKEVEKYKQNEVDGYDECNDEYSEYYQPPLYSLAVPGTKYECKFAIKIFFNLIFLWWNIFTDLDHTADVQ